ncbi:MAG: arginine--tRNA ligase, partial [Bacillota bacterium]
MNYLVERVRGGIAAALGKAVQQAVAAGDLPPLEMPAFVVEVPREKEHGDFATNAAMLLARPARRAPRQIAEIILSHLQAPELPLQKTEIAGPG